MQRIAGQFLECWVKPVVEGSGARRFGLDHQGSGAHAVGDCRRLEEGVVNELSAEALSLIAEIDAKPRQDDDRD